MGSAETQAALHTPTSSDTARLQVADRTRQSLSIGAYTLESGVTLPEVVVGYAAYGTLAADGRNALLVTHGYTSGPSMLTPGHHVAESSWAPLLEPGRPLDAGARSVAELSFGRDFVIDGRRAACQQQQGKQKTRNETCTGMSQRG